MRNFSVLKGYFHLEVKEGTGKHHTLGGITAVQSYGQQLGGA